MKRLALLTFLCCYSLTFWAQAEYQKIRDMYEPPTANVDIHVFKGHLDAVHPVEFYLGNREGEINGYYRLVSSGVTFQLAGELHKSTLILSEQTKSQEQVGELLAMEFDWDTVDPFVLQWKSLSNDDVLDFTLQRAGFRDFAPLAFKSSISKYCEYASGDCFVLEIFEENKADFVFLASAKRQSIRLTSADPLSFQLEDGRLFEHIATDRSISQTEKLRTKIGGQFVFYQKENKVDIKRMYYASENILSDVEYPIVNHEGFDAFILEIVNEQKQRTRDEIKELKQELSIDLQSAHYQYKWNGWTEIDFLGTSIISGRIVLNRFWQGQAERMIVPFVYDLDDDKSTTALEQFKPDFDIPTFVSRRIKAELAADKSLNSLQVSDFKYYSLSDKHLLVSTDFSPVLGCNVIKIPYSELKNWLRRNSLIKKIMRV